MMESVAMSETDRPVAVLCSGGLDSVVLVAEESTRATVQPVYVSVGLAWEAAELVALDRVLARPLFEGRVKPAARLAFTMTDVYPDSHWAVRGTPPGFDTPDEDVYIAGRNIVLLSKAAIFSASLGISRVAVAWLSGNPFPDATPEFVAAMARALSIGLAHPIEIAAPYSGLRKAEVVRRGLSLGVPLELTLSCMKPESDLHCGRCSKCRERRDAFLEAGVPDATRYAVVPLR
jgi:7-cyano-7-deazaguanine synthase